MTEEPGTLKLYWGAAANVICAGTAKIDDLVNLCLKKPRPAPGTAWKHTVLFRFGGYRNHEQSALA